MATITSRSVGAAALDGSVQATISPRLDAGSHTIGASYSDAPGFDVSSAQPISTQVAPATPIVTVNCPAPVFANGRKHPYACTATVMGIGGASVSGSLAVKYDGSSTAPFRMRTYSVVATFTSADPNYTNAIGTGTLSITHRIGDDADDD